MKTAPLFPIFLSFFLIQCVMPVRMYRLQPAEGSFKWVYGEPVVRSAVDSIEVVTTFLEQSRHDFVFYFEVWNHSEDTVLVAPDSFYYHFSQNPPRPDGVLADQSDPVRAHNPEQQIANLQKEISAQDAQHANYMLMDGTASLLNLVVDVASIGKPTTDEEERKKELQKQERETDRLNEEHGYRSRLTSLERTRSMWQTAALRKTTMYPGESVGGKVFFPVSPKARSLRMYLPIGSSLHTILYKQAQQ